MGDSVFTSTSGVAPHVNRLRMLVGIFVLNHRTNLGVTRRPYVTPEG